MKTTWVHQHMNGLKQVMQYIMEYYLTLKKKTSLLGTIWLDLEASVK